MTRDFTYIITGNTVSVVSHAGESLIVPLTSDITVALGDRKLYIIDMQNPTAAPTAVDLPVPNDVLTGVTGTLTRGRLGDLRPFAVQYYRGSIYVGAVNSAESTITIANTTGDQSRLRAYVFQFKLNTTANGSPTV